MDTLLLDEAPFVDTLFPFTWTRSVLDIRIGILTLREKWTHLSLNPIPNQLANPILNPDSPLPGNILPTADLLQMIRQEQAAQGLTPEAIARILPHARTIDHPWQIFEWNAMAIQDDFTLLTQDRRSAPIPTSVQTIHPENIFIEEGARISYAILNATNGPIYIGRNAEIMEGAMIRGPFALCDNAVVKMGATIYGATTVGPHSTVGGEIKNSVIFGYSNKAHHGYLGDAVIGEWCNLGAGTTNSNLKNSAGHVKVWDQSVRQFVTAGLKCGLLMGDYSRSAINTAFNTGTVTGPCCNIFGEGLTPKLIPAFTWGMDLHAKYEWEKALRDIANWKKLKNQSLREDEIQTLKLIFEKS